MNKGHSWQVLAAVSISYDNGFNGIRKEAACMNFDRTAPGGGVDVVCRLEHAKAYLEWNFFFINRREEEKGIVRLCLADRRGNVVMECRKALQEEEPVEGILMQPHFWQGEREPYLYEMEAVLTDRSGRIMDILAGQIPLRELRNRKMGNKMELLLNGVPFIPKAVFYSLPDGDAVVRQRQILEDLQQIKRLGSNCVCVKKEEPARLFLEFSRLCDRYGILVFVQEEQGRGEWVYHQDRKVRMEPGENIPDYRSVNNGLFMPGSRYPASLYYKYMAKWTEEPFIYLAPESVKRLKSGNFSVCCYSNSNRVALYTDGVLFEFQRGEEEFVFREIPAKTPCVMLTAEGEGCGTSLSIHKILLSNCD